MFSVRLFLLCQNQAPRERGNERIVAAAGGPTFLAFPVLCLHSQPRPWPPPRLLPCFHVHGGRDDRCVTPGKAGHREAEEEGEEAEEDEVSRDTFETY